MHLKYVLSDYNFNGGTGYAVISNANTASLNITATSGGTAYSGLPTYYKATLSNSITSELLKYT